MLREVKSLVKGHRAGLGFEPKSFDSKAWKELVVQQTYFLL